MRGRLLKNWSVLGVAMALGACSNIIGVSSYEIDPTLEDPGDGGSSSQAGSHSNGGGSHAGSSSEAGAPDAAGDGSGGSSIGGTGSGGKSTGGSPAVAGETGAGGEGGPIGPVSCKSNKDCDDTIDCTTDTCLADGKCGHAPKDTLCDSTQCETCTVGIGCVAGAKTKTQILLNPDFDDAVNEDWDDEAESPTVVNIVANAQAQSGTKIAKFGPNAAAAVKHQYSDLLQYITLPDGLVGLTVTGYYTLTPTAETVPVDEDDYVVLQVYDVLDISTSAVEFHSFDGTEPAQATWKSFSYDASKPELSAITAGDYTFDFVGLVFSTFQFDTVTLTTTVCQ
jgi:hypothetical protein